MNAVHGKSSFWRLVWKLFLTCIFVLSAAGCSLFHLRQEVETIYNSTILVGTVTLAGHQEKPPVVVAAYAKIGNERKIAHYTVIHEPGAYELIVPKGSWYIVAFTDPNNDLIYQQEEAIGQYSDQALVVDHAGGVLLDLNVLLQNHEPGSIDFPVGMAVAQTRPETLNFTSPGVVTSLDNPLFSEENGSKGFWRPVEFFKEFGGNIYFLAPYDPAKIPILFVHGATGTPEGWRYLLNHLDLTRFQPWFYYYPSGASIKSMADLLFWKVFNLQNKYQFKELYLVAHSMGGLVSRSFLVDYGHFFPSITKFISISTPWSGDSLSEKGVKYSPGVIPAWKDMGPQSEFAQSIYRKKLPVGIEYFLFFGHSGNRNPLRPNNDGVVTLASQLDPRVQAEAKMVCGFDEDHSSILTSNQVATLFANILQPNTEFARDGKPKFSGTLTVNFSRAMPKTPQDIWPDLQILPKGKNSNEGIFLKVNAVESGRTFGPFPVGEYYVRLLANGFRTEPIQQEVTIDPHTPTRVEFELIPAGSVSGFINRQFYDDADPAGIFMAANRGQIIRSIQLTGAGVKREVVPTKEKSFDVFEHYRSSNDWIYENSFAFYNIPKGNYLLTIKAEGYEPYSEERQVIPGKPVPFTGIDLTPLKQ